MTSPWRATAAVAALALACAAVPARAQTPQPPATTPPSAAAPVAPDTDMRVDPLQPDFTLVALPVTLRLPAGKMSFRVTHRFLRSLGAGDFGDLANDFFGFDSGAQIGLEFRYGIRPGTQVGIHRTSDRTIELFGQQSVWQERKGHPISLDVMGTFEGQNNLRDRKSPAVGVLASKRAGRFAAVYAEPFYVFHTDPAGAATGNDQNTLMLGLGARVRVRPSMYVAGEITPRLSGYDPGVSQMSFAVEGRVGGHLFQFNVGNGIGTTLGQLANGGMNNRSWFIGFNISRKFF